MTKVDEDRQKQKETEKFNGIVRAVQGDDLIKLKPILETWIKNRNTGEPIPEEVEEDLQFLRDSIKGQGNRTYLVAETTDNKVVGMIGLTSPGQRMLEFATTSNPTELINAYVDKSRRGGGGVGTALVQALEKVARQRGFTEILLNSGPRYKNTGWGFYDKLSGFERVGIAVKMYGEGGDAPVWRKELK